MYMFSDHDFQIASFIYSADNMCCTTRRKKFSPIIQMAVSGLHPHYIELFHITCRRILLYLSVKILHGTYISSKILISLTLNTFHTTALYLSTYFSIMCHHHYPLYIPDKENPKNMTSHKCGTTDALKVKKKTVKPIHVNG